jgi:hypothetical protein
MPEKAEALGVMLILLPGFASAYIVQSLAVRRKQTELDKIVEALLLSLVLYVITLPFFGHTLPIGWQSLGPARPDLYQIVVDYKHLVALAGLAVVLALLYAANINHDWLMTIFRWMRITERTARSTIWNDAFQEIGGFVQVGISDGRSLIGWLRHYSDESDNPALFLENAAWIVKKDGAEEEVAIEGPGILLTQATNIEYVIFLGWQKQEPDESKRGEAAEE